MLELTNLPRVVPERTLVIPTMNRWSTALPDLLTSLGPMVGTGSDSLLCIIADGTPESNGAEVAARAAVLAAMPAALRRSTYVLTPESQASIANEVQRRTGVAAEVVAAYLTWTGYASQRAKLDMVIRGYALDETKKVLTLDDDTTIPGCGLVLNPGASGEGGFARPNSQMIRREIPGEAAFTKVPNSLDGFFTRLGESLSPMMPASTMLRDTMHGALHEAQSSGCSAHFEVTVDEATIRSAAGGRIVATMASKWGVPDYRTVRVAEANLRDGLPTTEVRYTAFPAGPALEFAFQGASTNVDSACLGRLFDSRTARIGWWLITSTDLSLANPLRTVTGPYRADNELLPALLRQIEAQTGESLWYLGGIETQVQHHRARSGHRPEIIEQATASLLGNLVARGALEHLVVDAETLATSLRPISPEYSSPVEDLRGVFDQLADLAGVARARIGYLDGIRDEVRSEADAREWSRMRQGYEHVYESLSRKTKSFDFDTFAGHARQEIRKQREFYRQVLEAAPRLEGIVRDFIRSERHPALCAHREPMR